MIHAARPTPVLACIATTGLLLGIVAGFIIELSTGALGNDARLLWLGAISDASGVDHQWWRLLSYAWLHASTTHLVLNAGLLAWCGRIVERRLGAGRMLAIYAAGILAGGLAIVARAALYPQPGVSLGASAGVFALLTASLVLLHRRDLARFQSPAPVRIALWIILVGGLAASLRPGVSLAGHLAGLGIGSVAGAMARGVQERTEQERA